MGENSHLLCYIFGGGEKKERGNEGKGKERAVEGETKHSFISLVAASVLQKFLHRSSFSMLAILLYAYPHSLKGNYLVEL